MNISQDSKDLFRVKDASNTRDFIAHLAWDEEKAGYFQKSGSSETDQCIAIGFLWREYGAEIIKHILETSELRNATPPDAIEARLQRIEDALDKAMAVRIGIVRAFIKAAEKTAEELLKPLDKPDH